MAETLHSMVAVECVVFVYRTPLGRDGVLGPNYCIITYKL